MTVISNWGGHRPGAGPQGLHLKPAEALLIVDALNGTIIEPTLAEQQIPLEVEDACLTTRRLDLKWNVNRRNLVNRLKRLTHAQAIDLLDKITLFWSTREPTR